MNRNRVFALAWLALCLAAAAFWSIFYSSPSSMEIRAIGGIALVVIGVAPLLKRRLGVRERTPRQYLAFAAMCSAAAVAFLGAALLENRLHSLLVLNVVLWFGLSIIGFANYMRVRHS